MRKTERFRASYVVALRTCTYSRVSFRRHRVSCRVSWSSFVVRPELTLLRSGDIKSVSQTPQDLSNLHIEQMNGVQGILARVDTVPDALSCWGLQ